MLWKWWTSWQLLHTKLRHHKTGTIILMLHVIKVGGVIHPSTATNLLAQSCFCSWMLWQQVEWLFSHQEVLQGSHSLLPKLLAPISKNILHRCSILWCPFLKIMHIHWFAPGFFYPWQFLPGVGWGNFVGQSPQVIFFSPPPHLSQPLPTSSQRKQFSDLPQ